MLSFSIRFSFVPTKVGKNRNGQIFRLLFSFAFMYYPNFIPTENGCQMVAILDAKTRFIKNPIVYVPLTVVCVPSPNVYPLGRMGLALERIFLRLRTYPFGKTTQTFTVGSQSFASTDAIAGLRNANGGVRNANVYVGRRKNIRRTM
jgi:hypothetical protein